MSQVTNSGSNQEKIITLELRQGIIVFVDALGTKHLQEDDAKRLLGFRNSFWQRLKESRVESMLNDDYREKLPEGNDYKFADTIIIAWELDKDQMKEIQFYLPIVFEYLIQSVKLALSERILIRGAITFGEYFVGDENTILGPAVREAFEYQNETDWVGIVATPRCGFQISRFVLAKGGKKKYGGLFSEYEVPMRYSGTKFLWAVSWPFTYYCGMKRQDVRPAFYNHLAGFSKLPIEADMKYINTQKYFSNYPSYFKLKPGKEEEGFRDIKKNYRFPDD